MNKEYNYTDSGMYLHMNEKEFDKNYMRVNNIMDKADGDVDHAVRLATTQANRISVDNKAISRYRVAESLGFEDVAEVFMHRAYELGQVDKMTYRDYKLEKILG